MGWIFSTRPATKAAFVKQLLHEQFSDGRWELIDQSLRGNNLWTLVRPSAEESGPFIVLFRLQRQDGCWGYKDMDESMGPYYYDCPLGFLDRAPEPEGHNRNHGGTGRTWRDHVRDYHASQRQRQPRPRVGDVIRLDPVRFPGYSNNYLVTADLGRKGVLLDDYLRLSAHHLKWAELIPSAATASS